MQEYSLYWDYTCLIMVDCEWEYQNDQLSLHINHGIGFHLSYTVKTIWYCINKYQSPSSIMWRKLVTWRKSISSTSLCLCHVTCILLIFQWINNNNFKKISEINKCFWRYPFLINVFSAWQSWIKDCRRWHVPYILLQSPTVASSTENFQ